MNNTSSSSDPYNYPFLQKQQTMYLSTISKNDFKPSQTTFSRESSFQKKDIEGANPRVLIPRSPHDTGFSLSNFIQPIPQTSKFINKVSNPLYHDDIQGSKPKSNQFRTNRIVDPLNPVYKLPTSSPMSIEPSRNFQRDTLSIEDINQKKRTNMGDRGRQILREPIQGSQPSQLHKMVKANSSLQVKDINKQHIFQTKRTTNPLNPNYNWRDEQHQPPNTNYGNIQGTAPRRIHPQQISATKPQNACLNISDIQGTKSNSNFDKSYFIDKRRQFRNYMQVADIQKAGSSSLKKGIQTKRLTNPLMPTYQFPGHSEVVEQKWGKNK